MKKEKTKTRKAFPAIVNPDIEATGQLMVLSRANVHLWNLACDQAKCWLERNQRQQAIIEFFKTSITAFSFNFWLSGIRSYSVFPSREVARNKTAYLLWREGMRQPKSIILPNEEELYFSDVSSDCQREALRKLASSYQSYFELKKKNDWRAREPKPQNPDQFMTLSWTCPVIKDGYILVPGIKNSQIKIPLRTERPLKRQHGRKKRRPANPRLPHDFLEQQIKNKEVVHATLSMRDNRFQLNLVVAGDLSPIIEQPKFFRAIDFGAGDVAISDSNGNEFLIPTRRSDKYWTDQIAAVEARQELRTKGSRGYKRLADGRKKIHDIAGKQRASHQRKVADAIVEEKVECIILGKPRTRLGLSQSASGTPDQHYGVQNTGYMFRLLLFIKEKAEERGIQVIEFSDPQRMGDLDNAQNKFFASRSLLEQGMKGSELPIPTQFVQKKFHIDFGKGQPPARKSPVA